MIAPLLTIENLSISFPSDAGSVDTDVVPAVTSLSLTVGAEIVAIVGESGSGKSLTGRAAMGLLPRRAKVQADAMTFETTNLLTLDDKGWNRLRGRGMGLILQDPKFSLNPAHRVGRQVEEALLLHTDLSARERRARALDMLAKVGLPDPVRVYSSYPATLSGGMGQRVMIAAMLINRPKLIIADEPTSALDRDLQDQVLGLLQALTLEFGMGLLLISHDLQQVVRYADRVVVMRRGEIVEELPASGLADARSAYTRSLWAARPSFSTFGTRLPVLDAETQA